MVPYFFLNSLIGDFAVFIFILTSVGLGKEILQTVHVAGKEDISSVTNAAYRSCAEAGHVGCILLPQGPQGQSLQKVLSLILGHTLKHQKNGLPAVGQGRLQAQKGPAGPVNIRARFFIALGFVFLI